MRWGRRSCRPPSSAPEAKPRTAKNDRPRHRAIDYCLDMDRGTIRLFEARDLPRILRIENSSFGNDAWPAELFQEYALASPKLFLVAAVGRRHRGIQHRVHSASRRRVGVDCCAAGVSRARCCNPTPEDDSSESSPAGRDQHVAHGSTGQ